MTVPAILVQTGFIKTYKWRLVIFSILWVLFEWLYTLWDIAWPWLNFGHVLGNQIYFIQWYQYAGSFCGSLWLLFMGLIIYYALNHIISKKIFIIAFVFLSIFPIYSTILFFVPNKTSKSKTIMVINKLAPSSTQTNYGKIKSLVAYINRQNIKNIDYIMAYECYLDDIYPSELNKNEYLSYQINQIFYKNPTAILILGSKIKNNDSVKFNGISVISKDTTLFRTKKKYVPVVEYTPKFIRKNLLKTFSYMKNKNDNQQEIIRSTRVFPFVCYESIFTHFWNEQSNHDIDFNVLLTSEAFMGDSKTAKNQYLNIVKIRAIESQKPIVKISNQGIPCVINKKGEIKRIFNKNMEIIELKY